MFVSEGDLQIFLIHYLLVFLYYRKMSMEKIVCKADYGDKWAFIKNVLCILDRLANDFDVEGV